MMDLLAATPSPEIDYQGLAPVLAVAGGSVVVLLASLFEGRGVQRLLVPLLAAAALVVAIVFSVVNWEPGDSRPIVENALAIDTLALFMSLLFYVAGLAAIALSLRWESVQEAGAGEYYSMMLGSIAGMTLLAGAENLVTLFVGLELLSIPLYVLCASSVRDRHSLESGLKYLVIGSVGSATLLYGLAFVYGASGSTDFDGIARALDGRLGIGDPLLMTGIALAAVGLAFKASVAPFHQWTPDVYQGAPTPVTTFMAVATKAAAFAVLLRLFGGALFDFHDDWAPALAALAVATILIGNAGAIVQRSLKRLLAWSGVAQAGYMLAGVVVATKLGLQATAFYLAAYLVMNVAAFAVVIARERVSEHGDDIESLRDLSRAAPLLAWPMTIAMLALAGFPATAGFIGKFYLIDAAVAGDYAWLGIAIVVGSMISLVYYLRVIAVMWMDRLEITLPTNPPRSVKPITGWSPEADPRATPEITAVALLAAAATIFLGIYPSPLFDVVRDVGTSLGSLL
ncbi:MAG TPA: NADH-quinone oxidoreductase subunit N [Thermoleophilaceae bacterium]|nr:NADH-quinone oxidoreductase subunit N [Thermoleophilaceae bacterium]